MAKTGTRKTTAGDIGSALIGRMKQVIVGKDRQLQLVAATLIAGGHALLNDVPGLGKTKLARTLAAATGLEFNRVQATPDLLPTQVTGSNVYDQRSGEFRFRPGPVFANILLVDEINRATPRTQASLLECMEERQVTSDGVTRMLPEPFMVIATQNPVEFAGTFPLPEAQLDRFLVSLTLGYPEAGEEAEIVNRFAGGDPLGQVEAAISGQDLLAAREGLDEIVIVDPVMNYLLEVVRQTRSWPLVKLGASPRASIALARMSRTWAALAGRDYVTPDDVKAVAAPVLAHRLMLEGQAQLRGREATGIITEIIGQTEVPADTVERPL